MEPSVEPARSHHDPATRMLIESELRDAPPEERKEWLAYLNRVDSEMVPFILRSRRIEKGEPDPALPLADVRPSTPEIQPAAHTADAESERPNAKTDSPATDDPPPLLEHPAIRAESPRKLSETDSILNGLDAPEPVSGGSWPKRILSISEWEAPSLWPLKGDDDPPSPPRERPKPDRGPFGLPQIRGQRDEPSQPRPLRQDSSLEEPLPRVVSLDSSLENLDTRVSTLNSPRWSPAATHWEEELHKLISLMEAETSSLSSPTTASREEIRKQVALRMMYLISNEPQLAQQAIKGVSHHEQEFWTALFWGLSEYLDEHEAATPAERATQTIAQLRSAAYHLQQTAGLTARHLAFCERINSFGNYERFDRDEFNPGQSVLLYCEIRNFHSEPTDAGDYRTSIKSTVELLRGGTEGKLIDRSIHPVTEDRCRSLRTDYYHSYRIDLPMHLSPGLHILKLTLQDQISGKMTTQTIGFTIK